MLRLKLPKLLLVAFTALIAFPCYAQTNAFQNAARWNLSSITFIVSEHSETYAEMDYNNLLNVTNVPVSISEEMSEYQKAAYFNPNFTSKRIAASIGMIKNSDVKWNREVTFGARVMFGSEVILDYEEIENPNNEILFCLVENNIELEATHLFRRDTKNASFFFGPSISFGKSFGNEVMVARATQNTYSEEYYKAQSSFLLFGHMNVGAYVNLYKGLGMRMAIQQGCGYSVRNSLQNMIPKSFSYGYGLEYRFNN